jgi:hypothetical protein
MGESWLQREFLTPRRLAFNVLFYGIHFGLFAYGWYSQVGLMPSLVLGEPKPYCSTLTKSWRLSTHSLIPYGLLAAPGSCLLSMVA